MANGTGSSGRRPSASMAPAGGASPMAGGGGGTNLADVLERVLDKGIVVVGDIRINLLDIELLTIKLRLVIAGVDTARRMGINWWESDPWLTGGDAEEEGRSLRQRIERLERELGDEPRADRSLEEENRALREELDRLRHQLGEGSAPQEASGSRRAVGRAADDEATEDEPPDG